METTVKMTGTVTDFFLFAHVIYLLALNNLNDERSKFEQCPIKKALHTPKLIEACSVNGLLT